MAYKPWSRTPRSENQSQARSEQQDPVKSDSLVKRERENVLNHFLTSFSGIVVKFNFILGISWWPVRGV